MRVSCFKYCFDKCVFIKKCMCGHFIVSCIHIKKLLNAWDIFRENWLHTLKDNFILMWKQSTFSFWFWKIYLFSMWVRFQSWEYEWKRNDFQIKWKVLFCVQCNIMQNRKQNDNFDVLFPLKKIGDHFVICNFLF